jgi:hypothetical protein
MHRVSFSREHGAVYLEKPRCAGGSESSRPKNVCIAKEVRSNPKERSIFPYSAPFRFVIVLVSRWSCGGSPSLSLSADLQRVYRIAGV